MEKKSRGSVVWIWRSGGGHWTNGYWELFRRTVIAGIGTIPTRIGTLNFEKDSMLGRPEPREATEGFGLPLKENK